jgi:acetolactate synthase regulatory subunit
MTRKQLEQAVAARTGESLREIRRRGFSIVRMNAQDDEPEIYSLPNVVDWDQLDRDRQRAAA